MAVNWIGLFSFKELVMRVCFSAVAVVLSVVGAAFGGEVGQDGTQSVLVKSKPAPVVVESAPCVQGNSPCASGRCQTAPQPQLYNVEAHCDESCRNRLFGGKVVRKSSRTVYKPVRR
jgi:hypothetical protein